MFSLYIYVYVCYKLNLSLGYFFQPRSNFNNLGYFFYQLSEKGPLFFWGVVEK